MAGKFFNFAPLGFRKFIEYLAKSMEYSSNTPTTNYPWDLPSSPPGEGAHCIKITTLQYYYYQISFLP